MHPEGTRPPEGWQAPSAQYIVRMATNLDVDLKALDELVDLGSFRSKREAVDAAVREAIAWRKQLRSLEVLGTIDFTSVVGSVPAEPS